MIKSLNDGLARPKSTTSPSENGFFTLRSSDLIYSARFTITFWQFIDILVCVAELYDWMLLLTLIHFGEGDQYFHLETIYSWLSTKAKTRITLQEMQFLRKFFLVRLTLTYWFFTLVEVIHSNQGGGHSQQSGWLENPKFPLWLQSWRCQVINY